MKKVAIIGLGVIGGSLGMALGATGRYHVIGIDRDPEALRMAAETGAAAEVTGDARTGVRRAEVVFLAVPVTAIIETAKVIKDSLPPGAVVTDVGSTKQLVVETLEKYFSGRFVGGHPMTGSELRGIRGADQYLFENAVYVLTPDSHTSPEALETVRAVVADTGARVLCLSPQEHDLMVAAVSHLPHLLAVSLMNLASGVAAEHPETLTLAAGGFRDLTRIASSHPSMWRDVYATNRRNIVEASRRLRSLLKRIEESLLQENFDVVVAEMQRARRERQKIPLRTRGLLPAIYEVMVTIPDRPGSIAEVAGAIAAAGLNIVDIEIVRVREGDGGTLRVAFKKSEEADSAQRVLRERGFVARRR